MQWAGFGRWLRNDTGANLCIVEQGKASPLIASREKRKLSVFEASYLVSPFSKARFALQESKGLWMGARKSVSRAEAIEEYVILRLRTEDINRLDFLLNALYDKRIAVSPDSPFSSEDLKDTVRTAFFGWFASLTDRDGRAIYAFDCLFALFPERKAQIIKVQLSLEAVHDKLQQFRNNVAFHARGKVAAHIAARLNFRDEETYLDLVSAIHDFQDLMKTLRTEELNAIPELPRALEQLRVNLHPAFAPSKK